MVKKSQHHVGLERRPDAIRLEKRSSDLILTFSTACCKVVIECQNLFGPLATICFQWILRF
jgi:hypothetical protein